MKHFSCFQIPSGSLCLHQRDGGALAADRCVAAHLRLAVEHGASLHTRERVVAIHRESTGLRVQTNLARYQTDRLIVAAGGWTPMLFPEQTLPLRVTRQAVAYFLPESADPFRPDKMPVWVYVGPGEVDATVFYGLPIFGRFGAKVAYHSTSGPGVDPDTVERTPTESDYTDVREFLVRHIPQLARAPMVDPHICLYSMLPDEHFLIDEHPDDSRILIASACSGHGFKFSSLIGRILAELAVDGQSSVGPFEAHRALFRLTKNEA